MGSRTSPCGKTNLVTNAYIAEQLEAFASLLDLSGAGHYTSRAYRRAAETIRETKAPIAELVTAGRVEELRGIGAGIAARCASSSRPGTSPCWRSFSGKCSR